jgi:NADH:ubiquinone oxidoreductase subunit K
VAIALAVWTLVVWATRIRNVAEAGGGAADLLVPVGLTVLAVAALVDRRRGAPVLAAATIAVWAVRLPFVLAHDHPAGFKVVHAVLAVVSMGLAAAELRSRSGQRRRAAAVPAGEVGEVGAR